MFFNLTIALHSLKDFAFDYIDPRDIMIIIQFMNQSLISLSHDKNGKVELMRPEAILFVRNLAVTVSAKTTVKVELMRPEPILFVRNLAVTVSETNSGFKFFFGSKI